MNRKEIKNEAGRVAAYEFRPDGDMRKDVYIPSHSPEGRTPDETYRCVAMRSACRIEGRVGGICFHRGPYAALWEDDHLASNPDRGAWGDPGFCHTAPSCLPNEWVVTRHDEDTGLFEVLYRATNRKSAFQFFSDLEDEYPESDLPKSKRGGARPGAGHPVELGESKLLSIDMPLDLLVGLDKIIQQRLERGEKVSRAHLIREFVRRAMTS